MDYFSKTLIFFFFKKEDNISQKLINPLGVLGCLLPSFGMLEEFKCKIEKLKGYFLLGGNPDLTIWIDFKVQQGFSVFSSPK